MLLHYTEVNGYGAFGCAKINKLRAVFVSPVQITIADNGMGKSRWLATMHDLPALRPNYNKDGNIEIGLSHEGHEYTIRSDFSKREKAHSFIRDGNIELNSSGTTHTSAELLVTHLGLTPLVNSLMQVTDICGMGNIDRKQLFLSAYPNDMTFVLSAHKKVSSQLRGFKNNMKLLKSRKSMLQDQLIETSQFERLQSLQAKLIRDVQAVDKLIFVTTNNINTLSNHVAYTGYIAPDDWDIDKINHTCKKILRQTLHHRQQHPDLFKEDSLAEADKVTLMKLEASKREYEGLLNGTVILRQEIEEFENYFDTDIDNEIRETEATIKRYTKLLEGVELRSDIPVLREEDILYVESKISPTLLSLISSLASIPIIATGSFAKITQKIDLILAIITDLNRTHAYEVAELIKLRKIIDNERYRYPSECSRGCELRDNISTLLQSTQNDANRMLERHDITVRKLARANKCYDVLSRTANRFQAAIPCIEQLKTLLRDLPWKNDLYGDTLIATIKHRPFHITTVVAQIVENSKLFILQSEYKSTLSTALLKLATLKELNVSHKLISKSIVNKQVTFKEQTAKCVILYDTIVKLNSKLNGVKELRRDSAIVKDIEKRFNDYKGYKYITEGIKLNQHILDSCATVKARMQERLIAIESTIVEQTGYTTRLQDEIAPMLASLVENEKHWAMVETALSPNGLPKKCMGLFLNDVINKVNTYLSIVWGYDLSLLPIETTAPMDFNFKVDSGTIISDIRKCSTGQRDMINLAWTLALREQTGIQSKYPLFIDEIDSGFSTGNRERLFELLSMLTQTKQIEQLFLINHHIELFEAFNNSEILCLSENNITIPKVYNEHVEMG